MPPSLCIVVSFYDERPSTDLIRLLTGLKRITDSSSFNYKFRVKIAVSINTVSNNKLNLPAEFSDIEVIYRPNGGFNMGAWDHGWRSLPGHRHYLFLQDECTVIRDDALHRYWSLLEFSSGSQIIGESLQLWRSWRQLNRKWPAAGEKIARMSNALKIPLGRTPSHLQTLAVAASGRALQEIDGFVLANEKIEAVCAEVLLSRKAVSKGLSLKQSAWRPFEYFGHEQWSEVRSNSFYPAWHLSRLFSIVQERVHQTPF